MYNYNDRFALHYNPEKYRKYREAALKAYFDVLTAQCEHFEHDCYTFKLHTKNGAILCAVREDHEFVRVYTICDDTDICYREQMCIDKTA